MHSSYEIAFLRAGSWSFDNNFAMNVVIFCFDNSKTSHCDNWKNIFLLKLGKGPTDEINGSVGTTEQMFSILSSHYNDNDSYLFVNDEKIHKFKADNKNIDFNTQFCLGNISEKSDVTKSG